MLRFPLVRVLSTSHATVLPGARRSDVGARAGPSLDVPPAPRSALSGVPTNHNSFSVQNFHIPKKAG